MLGVPKGFGPRNVLSLVPASLTLGVKRWRGKQVAPTWLDRPSSSSPLAPRFAKYLMSATWPRAPAGRTFPPLSPLREQEAGRPAPLDPRREAAAP